MTSRSNWPREHRKKPNQYPPQAKHPYQSLVEAREAGERERKDAYQCSFCMYWHIGSRGGSEEE